jgi:hypothetical protein
MLPPGAEAPPSLGWLPPVALEPSGYVVLLADFPQPEVMANASRTVQNAILDIGMAPFRRFRGGNSAPETGLNYEP